MLLVFIFHRIIGNTSIIINNFERTVFQNGGTDLGKYHKALKHVAIYGKPYGKWEI